jgi:glycosyltransferase involved in cell wall biosynthesis
MQEMGTEPLVSVVTPVYDGEEFLRECIESVLAQSYRNWEYTIVNNCSTDRTLEIAEEYAARDPRIRVHSNRQFAGIIQNHNIALRWISPQSKYCKVVFADDWLFPQCLLEMVKVAEAHPSVGIVGAYALDSTKVLWDGLPYPSTFVSGRTLCRGTLLGGPYVFGTPTSLLMRSDLVRARESFYNESNLHADHEACYEVLQDSDFGFVHQVLTFSRPRPESNAVAARSLESYILGSLTALVTHGPSYLTRDEYEPRLEQRMKQYYNVLAKNVLRLREKKFWDYHREKLASLGYPLNQTRLAMAVLREVLESLSRPLDALDGVRTWWPRTFSRMHNK